MSDLEPVDDRRSVTVTGCAASMRVGRPVS